MRLFYILLLLMPFFAKSQTKSLLWLDVGTKVELTKKLTAGTYINSRFDNNGVNQAFLSVSAKYKVTKWFRPSIEYRYIIERDNYFNYIDANRLNLNTEFKGAYKKFEMALRLRYQFGFSHLRPTTYYDVEFDNAFRFKPSIVYKTKNEIITPEISMEWFVSNHLGYQQISKLRTAIGMEIKLKGPHKLNVAYLFDYGINASNLKNKHILNLGYVYEFSLVKSKEKKKK